MASELMTVAEARNWRAYRKTRDVRARNRLIERHLGLVHHFARRTARSTGGEIGLEELVSAGTIGLFEAVSTYDPERGYRFSTYAAPRIRGAMLDELRRRDTAPRSVRRKQRSIEAAEGCLTAALDRAPRHREVAAALAVDEQTLWGWKSDVADAGQRHVTRHVSDGLRAPVAEVADPSWREIEERLEREQEVTRLRRELERLSERERLVLTLYDFEELKLKEIAQLLEITESRVSQIRTGALQRLRQSLEREAVAA